MRTLILSLLLLSIITSLKGQTYHISGQIQNSSTEEALAFVNIVINKSSIGGITDINGKFTLSSDEPIHFLRISYVGYESDTIFISPGQESVNIKLKRSAVQLNEVIILPGVNPAHRIIDSAITKRKENDPFNLESFTYDGYGKFYITVGMDSIMATPNHMLDSEDLEIKTFFTEHYLFFMESITKHKYKKPSLNNETIIASKVSGFSDPLFTLLIGQIQSFAFYNDLITISDKNYVNPISKGSTSKYFFLLQDTIYDGADSIFVISYRPKKNRKFDALKGVLYIHTDNWALQSVIAEPMEMEQGMSIKIKQNYSQVDSIHWFPSQLHTEIYFSNIQLDDYLVFGRGITQVSNVKINSELKRRDFHDATVRIEPDANDKDEEYWNNIRPDSLSKKEINTYSFIDSIGKKNHFDRLLDITMVLIEGFIPIGPLSIDINSIYRYNEIEGSRLGLGLRSNYKVSRRWSIGTYYAYGFKDKKHKFGADLKIKLISDRNMYINAFVKQDIRESGDISMGSSSMNIFSSENFRSFLLTRADYIQEYRLGVNFKIGKNFSFYPNIGTHYLQSSEDILYGQETSSGFSGTNSFYYSDISIYSKIAFGEKRVSSENYNLLLGNPILKPLIQIQLQKAIPEILNSTISFYSAKIKCFQSIKSKYFGTFSYKIQAGWISKNIPLSLSFNAPSSYRQFTIASPGSFETMRMNEFYSNKFVFVFLRHSFNYLIFGKGKFAPIPEFTTSFALGSYDRMDYIQAPEFKTLEKGYIESGFFLNNLLNTGFYSLGMGVVYRYGVHHLPELKDNFAYKISFTTVL